MSLGGLLPMGVCFMIVFPVALSPPARRAFVAWLGRLGSAGEERKAAAVAAFMGEIGPEKALALGKKTFVGLKWKSFTPDDLKNTDLAATTGLRNKTMKLRLGGCDAFLSHSWHDPAAAKWAAPDSSDPLAHKRNRRRRPRNLVVAKLGLMSSSRNSASICRHHNLQQTSLRRWPYPKP